MTTAPIEVHDDALRTKAAAGCPDALQALLERHAATAVRSAHAILGNHDDALDVAQETLLKLATEIRSPWRGGSFQAWVAIVAQRIALNRRKGEQVRKRREELVGMNTETAAPAPDAALELAESLEVLRSELASLPELSADVILLHYIHHLPIAEIARQTHLSVDACKQRLARGRDELNERLRRRGIALACLLLLAGLSSAADACAGEAAGQSSAMAARASRRAKAPHKNQIPQTNPAYPVIVGTVLLLTLGSFMARESFSGARAPWTANNTTAVSHSDTHIAQENPTMTHKFGYYARAAVLAAAAATAAHAENAPQPTAPIQPQTIQVADFTTPLVRLQTQTISTFSGDREVRINIDNVADALKSMPEDALAKIPGDDLTAKAKHLLENPSIPKKVTYAPMSMSVSVGVGVGVPGLPLPDAASTENAAPPPAPAPAPAPIAGRADATPAAVTDGSGAKPKFFAYRLVSKPNQTGSPESALARAWSWLANNQNHPAADANVPDMAALALLGADAIKSASRVAINMSSATPPQVESIQVETLPEFPLQSMPELKALVESKPAQPLAASRDQIWIAPAPAINNPPMTMTFKTQLPRALQNLVQPLLDNTLFKSMNLDDKRVFEAPDRVEGKDYIFKANDDKKDAPAVAAPDTAPQKSPDAKDEF